MKDVWPFIKRSFYHSCVVLVPQCDSSIFQQIYTLIFVIQYIFHTMKYSTHDGVVTARILSGWADGSAAAYMTYDPTRLQTQYEQSY